MRTPTFKCLECGSNDTEWRIGFVYCYKCKRAVKAEKDLKTEKEHKISRVLEYVIHPKRYKNFKHAWAGKI